jgi:hypothetical protein
MGAILALKGMKHCHFPAPVPHPVPLRANPEQRSEGITGPCPPGWQTHQQAMVYSEGPKAGRKGCVDREGGPVQTQPFYSTTTQQERVS